MNRACGLALGCLALSAATHAAETTAEQPLLGRMTVEASPYTSELTVGGKTPLRAREIPNSVSVITAQRIEDQNLQTVADALANVPAVTVVPNDQLTSQYRSRGYSLAVMYDGVPAYNAFGGVQQFDLAIYERVEVLRGPAGVLQGSSEPGGTVNLISKRGTEQFNLSTALSGGSWDNYRAVLDVAGPVNASRSLRARAVGLYQDRDFFYDSTTKSTGLGYATVDWDISSDTTVGVSAAVENVRSHATNLGLPAYETGELLDVPRSTGLAPPWSKFRSEIRDHEVSLTHRFGGGWTAKARLTERDQDYFFHDAYAWEGVRASDNTVPMVRREYDYDYERRALDLFLTGPVTLFGRTHSLLVGYNHDTLDSRFGGVSLVSAAQAIRVPFDHPEQLPDFSLPYNEGGLTETGQSGVYAQARFSVADPLTLVVGGRLSDFHSRSRSQPPGPPTAWRPTNRADDEFTPYGGVVYDVNRLVSLYASYSSIFVPQSTQRKVDGESLEPRIGRQYEIGSKADFFGGRLSASVAVFNLRDRNRPLSDTAHPGFVVPAGEVESKGWEAQVSGSPAPGYEVQAGYARLDTEYLKANPNQQGLQFDLLEPRHSWKVWAIHRFQERLSGLTVGLGFSTQSGIRVDPKRGEGGFTVANAMLGYRIGEHASLDFNVSNLFDKVYYTRFGGTNSYNTFGEPRNYSLTVRVKL